jgi:hypothetical protein
MKSAVATPTRTVTFGLLFSMLVTPGFVFAQDQPDNSPVPPEVQRQNPPNTGGWRRADEPAPGQPSSSSSPNYYPNYSQNQGPYSNRGPAPSYGPVPSQLTIKPGTFVTVRINEPLSSDRNQPGDAFSASLVKPLVVDGVVLAERGQTIGGRVSEAKKAGRVEGTSRLGVQLTELTMADGQQIPIQSQLISRSGGTSVGRDVGAVAGTTAVGAAVGAAADWGRGAAIGAGAGAAVGIIGVLLTRGHPTIIYPESVLTFQLKAPVTVSTARAPQAFRYVEPTDYERPYYEDRPRQSACAGYGCAPAPYPYPYYGGYYGYPYYYGPGLGFYYGPSFFWGRGYYGGRGFYGGGFYGGRAYGGGRGGRR